MAASQPDPNQVHPPALPADTLAQLRAQLLSDRAARVALFSGQTADGAEPDAREATSDEARWERDHADMTIAVEGETLAEIDAALQRMEAGTYGVCESCAHAIPVERLEAITHTRHCVSCSAQQSMMLRVSR